MTSIDIRENLIIILKQHFPGIFLTKTATMKRVNVIYPNDREKRWMQLDANDTHLHIAMDHKGSEISSEHGKELGLHIGVSKNRSTVRISDSSVKFTIYPADAYDFSNQAFVNFLNQHFQSYLRRIKD